jgi:Protein of unknown function (DUF3105)
VLGVSLLLAIGLVLVLSGALSDRDLGGVSGAQNATGNSFRDQGDAQLRPGEARPHYDSDPPTSGAHHRVEVTRDNAPLSVDQLLSALATGDVVVEYGGTQPPPGLRALADRLAGPFTPALAADGQAVVLSPARGTSGLLALAWTRMAALSGPNVPLLRQFIQAWLGRGALGNTQP